MSKSRQHYYVSGNSLQELTNALNLYLADISDRLDKVEGLRAEFETAGSGVFIGRASVKDSDGNEIHQMGD